jgi:hypothetical protein
MISSENVLKKALLTLIDRQIYVIFRLFRHNLTDNNGYPHHSMYVFTFWFYLFKKSQRELKKLNGNRCFNGGMSLIVYNLKILKSIVKN